MPVKWPILKYCKCCWTNFPALAPGRLLKILSSQWLIFNSNYFPLKFSDNAIAIHCRSVKLKFSAILLAFQIPSCSNQPFLQIHSRFADLCYLATAAEVLIDNLSEAVLIRCLRVLAAVCPLLGDKYPLIANQPNKQTNKQKTNKHTNKQTKNKQTCLLEKYFWPHCGKVEFCPNTTNAGRRCPPASPWCLCHVSDCFFPLLAAAFAMPGTLYLAIYSDLISCLCRWYYAPCSDVWRWPMTNRFVKRQLKVR